MFDFLLKIFQNLYLIEKFLVLQLWTMPDKKGHGSAANFIKIPTDSDLMKQISFYYIMKRSLIILIRISRCNELQHHVIQNAEKLKISFFRLIALQFTKQ